MTGGCRIRFLELQQGDGGGMGFLAAPSWLLEDPFQDLRDKTDREGWVSKSTLLVGGI